MKTITIIGTGLIGTSMGLAFRNQGLFVVGIDKNDENLSKAKDLGAIDAASQSLNPLMVIGAIKQSSAVILATPVDVILKILPEILDNIPNDGVVIDAGSTKSSICQSIQSHPERSQFVAAHPMAGSEQSGPSTARADLFNGRKVVICERELSSKKSLETAKLVFGLLGMQAIYLSPIEHDDAVALVSHIPQLLAYAYAGMNDFDSLNDICWESIASSGFESFTRLASSTPEIWLPILKQNRQNLIKRLRYLSLTLNQVADEFEEDANSNIESIVNRAKRTRQAFENKQFEILNNTESNLTN